MSPVSRLTMAPLLVAVLAIWSDTAGASTKRQPHLFGPPPAWEKYREIAEASISATLFDPGSAQIAWMGGYAKGWFKPFLSPRIDGYYACGVINARNRLGGYVGARAFIVVIDYDRVLYSEIDTSASGAVTNRCLRAREDGALPALPSNVSPTATASMTKDTSAPWATSTMTGLTLRPMPDGAYVSAVAPGSLSAVAGLKPGMVISSVNAIPLRGMGDAMLKVIDAAGGTARLVVIGGGTINLGGRP